MLNICSKEELEEEMDLQFPPVPVPPEPTPPTTTAPKPKDEREARRQVIRNKVLAIGRLSRVFSVLREESESVSELRRVSGNVRLPVGTLMLGAEGIKQGIIQIALDALIQAIHSFEEARRSDLQNERLPPSRSEVDEMNANALTDAMQRASDTRDPTLEAVAKRFSM